MCRQGGTPGKPCQLPFCTYAKRKPKAVRGRNKREREWIAANPLCAVCGKPAVHVHHVTRRGMAGEKRDTSPLQSLCLVHHLEAHGERVKEV